MTFKDKAAERYFLTENSPVIISDSQTNRVLWMNETAITTLGDLLGKEAKEYYKLDEEGLEWYQGVKRANCSCSVFPIHPNNTNCEQLFESVFLEEENTGRLLRIDLVQTSKEQEIDTISIRYDLVSNYQSWTCNSVVPLADNMNDFLGAALYIYAADRAFVLEIDKALECVVDLFSKKRVGFSSEVDSTRSTDANGVNVLETLWLEGRTLVLEEYNKNVQNDVLKRQLYSNLDSWSCIIVPFSKASGIRCFLCMDNPRRFKNNTSVARNITLLMTGYLYADEMRNNIDVARGLSAKLSHLPENLIKIHLLGGLKVSTNMGIQQDSNFFSSQCGTFFVYLLSNRRRMVPIRELTEVLWPEEIIDNPYNMIKNVAFRTRKMFDNVCPLPIIVAGNGTYCINKKLEIWIDIDEFERLYQQAKNKDIDVNLRISACKKALELYSGCMLPNFDGETWLMARISYYQVLFVDLINVYVDLLEQRGEYREIIKVIACASERERLDGHVHFTALKALIKSSNLRLAKQYYNKMSKELPLEDKEAFWELYKKKKRNGIVKNAQN